MSPADIHAVLLILYLCLSISIPATNYHYRYPPRDYIIGLLVAVAMAGALLATQLEPGSPREQPYRQIAITSLCSGVIAASLRTYFTKLTGLLVLVPLSVYLCQNHRTLIDDDRFCADPVVRQVLSDKAAGALLDRIYATIGHPPEGNLEGWVIDTPFGKSIDPAFRAEFEDHKRLEPHSTWHTPLSGIYDVWARPMGLWFAKGPPPAYDFKPLDLLMETRPSSEGYKKRLPLLDGRENVQKR